MKNVMLCLLVVILILPANGELARSLQSVVDRDTVRNVWVFFNDRPAGGEAGRVSGRAVLRRQRAGFRAGAGDRPVSRLYIAEIEKRGGALRHTFDWENAASFSVHASRLSEIASLPFVGSVAPVAVYTRKDVDDGGPRLGRSAQASSFAAAGYGWHLDMVGVPLAHEYLAEKGFGEPGSGVVVAFFDSGFRLDHGAFSRVRDSGQVIGVYDFVDGDLTVFDPDSVVNDSTHAQYKSDEHGTNVFGLVSGHHPGHYLGVAWGADFALARTEDIAVEARVEEDNWAAAVIWAESLGADIISSSLGYRSGFDDPSEDYEYRDMDGATAIASKAAAGAVARGVIVVNAVGNDGLNVPGSLSSPADVDGVVAVGAVDRLRYVSSFSSTGPTSDGRVKPDVIAPGTGVRLAEPYGPGLWSYGDGSGTSFSTPIVSGMLALILQANPGITAAEARGRLYGSCVFAPRQQFVDNGFGHGIPNAVRAMMGENEVFVKITDRAGADLTGAQVRHGANVYAVSESGNLLLTAGPDELPMEMKILFRNAEVGAFTVDSLPFAGVIAADAKREDGLKVRPNIVRRNGVVKGRYLFSGLDASAPATASVLTINGKKIWEQRLQIRPDGTAEFAWDRRSGGGRGRGNIPSGVYFITVKHGYHRISERILIAE